MRQRDDESRKDRDGEDLVGNGNVGKRDNGNPDEIEDCDRNPDRFRTQPVQPTDRKFAFLLARQSGGAGQQVTPMLSQDLEAAISPAMALLLIGLESIG